MTVWLKISAVLFLLVAVACSNSANDDNADNSLSEAQQVLQQFGELQDYFTEEAIQALLDYEDSGRPVTLLPGAEYWCFVYPVTSQPFETVPLPIPCSRISCNIGRSITTEES